MALKLPKSNLAKTLLTPASLVYKALVAARASAYKSGLAASSKVEVPVVSVGNITVGGTGKTPITMYLAKNLIAQGYKVGILSRGYNRQSNSDHVVASDGIKIQCAVEDCGDEPYMMALEVPQAVVICGRSRTSIARIAIDQYKCNLLILDDGFQHIRLNRDINIALLDYNDNLESELLLPAGRLREPVSALSRATHVVITKVPQTVDNNKLLALENLVRAHSSQCKVYTCRFTLEKLESLRNKTAVAFAGIARPDQFFDDLRSSGLGVTLLETLQFPDHHWYEDSDLKKIQDTFLKTQTDIGLTTKKDLARLSSHYQEPGVASVLERTAAIGLELEWIGDPLILRIE